MQTKIGKVQKRVVRLELVFVLIMGTILLTAAAFLAFATPDSNIPSIIPYGGVQYSLSYQIFKEVHDASYESSYYYLKDCRTGDIAYEHANCTLVTQKAHDLAHHGSEIGYKHGDYYYDGTVRISKNLKWSGEAEGFTWNGQSKGTSLLLAEDCPLFYWNNTEHCYGGWFEDLYFDGNNHTAQKSVSWWANNIGIANLILMEGGISDVFFNHVCFMDCGTEALRITAFYSKIWNIWVIDSFVENNFGGGIWLNTGDSGYTLERVHIRGTHFYDNSHDIIITDAESTDVEIIENTSEQTRKTFLWVWEAQYVTAALNHVYDAGMEISGDASNAFHINCSYGSKFIGNTVRNKNYASIEDGFYITDTEWSKIDENIVMNITGNAIELQYTSNFNSVNDNTIRHANIGIIIQSGCSENIVDGNTAHHCSSANWQNSGTSTLVGDNNFAS